MTLEQAAEQLIRDKYEDFVVEGWECTVSACPICGLLRWSSSDKKGEGFKVKVVDAADPCSRCAEVHARSPEIFGWVLGVARRLRDSQEGGQRADA